jgi:hypothetical protein
MVGEEVRQHLLGNFSCGSVVPIGIHTLLELRTLTLDVVIPTSGLIRWRIALREAVVNLLALGGTKGL